MAVVVPETMSSVTVDALDHLRMWLGQELADNAFYESLDQSLDGGWREEVVRERVSLAMVQAIVDELTECDIDAVGLLNAWHEQEWEAPED